MHGEKGRYEHCMLEQEPWSQPIPDTKMFASSVWHINKSCIKKQNQRIKKNIFHKFFYFAFTDTVCGYTVAQNHQLF